MKDPIADMIIALKNAGTMKKESVVFTHSKLKMAILETLAAAGFVASVTRKGKKVIKYIDVKLAYDASGMPRISQTKRVSKTSKRMYMKAKEIRSVRSGHGLMILSTPKGILTDKAARESKVGGEALFSVW